MGLLLGCSIRAALIAAAVAAVVSGLRIANASARHLAWCGVLAGMLLLPAFSLWDRRQPFGCCRCRRLPKRLELSLGFRRCPGMRDRPVRRPRNLNCRQSNSPPGGSRWDRIFCSRRIF